MSNRLAIGLSRRAFIVALVGSTLFGGLAAATVGRPASAERGTAGRCASLAGVTSFHGHARLNFNTTAVGIDPDNQENEKIQISRLASSLRIDLTRKVTDAALGIVTFIGHAHGGLINVDDNATEGDGPSKYAGHQSYNGPMLAAYGAAQLYVDTRRCAYKLHITFLVHADYAGSKQIQPPPSVSGFFWTAPEPLPGSLHLVGGDAPEAYTGGCPGNPLLSAQACYDFNGGWAKQVATLARTRGPFNGAATIWVLMPAT